MSSGANNLALYDSADWWNTKSAFYMLNKMNPGRFKYFDKFIHSWKDSRVLDVGCGGGFSCEFMAHKGAQVHGVDSSIPLIEQAKSHAALSNLNIEYKAGSALSLPYENESFDAVTCVDVLEHIPSWPLAIAEIFRVLKPGGHFLFDTINRNFASSAIVVGLFEYVLGLVPKGTHDFRLFIKPSELEKELVKLKFSSIEMTGFTLLWLPQKLDFQAFAGGPKTLMYIGHCVKRNIQ